MPFFALREDDIAPKRAASARKFTTVCFFKRSSDRYLPFLGHSLIINSILQSDFAEEEKYLAREYMVCLIKSLVNEHSIDVIVILPLVQPNLAPDAAKWGHKKLKSDGENQEDFSIKRHLFYVSLKNITFLISNASRITKSHATFKTVMIRGFDDKLN